MSYIGKTPTVGNFQVCDAISVVNGQAAYTMQVDSVNVVPESANHMLVSLNGILQKPGSSFTVSGSTITFASALSTGDVIDFITLLGNVLDLGVPSDATVTNAKTNFTSTSSAAGLQIKGDGTTDGTLQLNCSQNSHGIKLKSPPHSASQSYTLTFPSTAPATDKILQTNSSGVLSFVDQAGGGLIFLNTQTVSGAVSYVNFDNQISSTYDNYVIFYHKVGHDHSGNATMRAHFGTGSTPSYDTSSNYKYTYIYHQATSGGSDNIDGAGVGGSTAYMQFGLSSRASFHNGTIFLTGMNNTGSWQKGARADYFAHDQNENTFEHAYMSCVFNNSNPATSIRFYFTSGNVSSGVFSIYGVSKS